MRVVVNARFAGRRLSGVDRYAAEITARWDGGMRLIRPKQHLSGMRGHVWEQLLLPRMITRDQLLWSPANSGPVAVSQQVVTIHDTSVLEHPEWFARSFVLWYRLMLPWLARRARHVLTVSEHSRGRILQNLGLPADKVTAIPNGVDVRRFRPRDAQAVREKYDLRGRYVLFVGSIDARKNIARLLRAWERMSEDPDIQLVIAGAASKVFRRVRMVHSSRTVRYLGYAPEEDLPALYAGAVCLVMPSLFEGFGLPVLEAMACGTPVIASTAGALPEVTAGCALEVDPQSVEEIAGAMRRMLSDEALRRELNQKGLERAHEFPWERSAERIWEILARCA